MADRFLLENGTDRILLEDGTSFLILEAHVQAGTQAPLPHIGLLLQAASSITTGRSDETDTALALTLVKQFAVARADETDSALALSLTKVVTTGELAEETDSAFSFALTKFFAVARSDETDTALALNLSGALARAENPAPLPHLGLNWQFLFTTTPAVETDTALAPVLVRLKDAGRSDETDSALALAIQNTFTVGTALESDAAQPLAFDIQGVPARPFDWGHPQAWFSDPGFAALYLVPPGGIAVASRGASTFVDTGVGLETDLALTLTGTKFVSTGTSVQTNTALSVAWLKTKTTGVAAATDAALAPAVLKLAGVGTAPETDTAQSIPLAGGVSVSPCFEVDGAFALTLVRVVTGSLQADETDLARALGIFNGIAINTEIAAELNEAFGSFLIDKFVEVGRAQEIGAAIQRPFEGSENEEILALQAALNLERMWRGGITKRGAAEDAEQKMIREQNAAIINFVGSFLNEHEMIE